jgi:inner membrane protein
MQSLKLLVRFVIIGGLIVLLLIPLFMIRGVITDRKHYRDQAVSTVAQSSAGEQHFIGPVRYLPWTREYNVMESDTEGESRLVRKKESGAVAQYPAKLRVEGGLTPQQRQIGLFKVPVYTWKAQLQAEFEPFNYAGTADVVYGAPYLAIGMSDVRGLQDAHLAIDGQTATLESGNGAMPRVSGVRAVFAQHAVREGADPADISLPALHSVQLDLQLAGTQSLAVVPIGDSNEIKLHSSWPHPSFVEGQFLPNQRTVSAAGFSAEWSLSSLATRAQYQLSNGLDPQHIGVSLVDPVDVYTKADRASKYGVLFVVLTFTGFILLELIKRLRIHPLQYLLVGLALAIFFLLVLSLSEHLAFWQAYLASATACIGLQAVYLSGVLRSRVLAGVFSVLLTLLYGALYLLLGLEDSALLLGSLLLFGVRKLDWYELGAQLR